MSTLYAAKHPELAAVKIDITTNLEADLKKTRGYKKFELLKAVRSTLDDQDEAYAALLLIKDFVYEKLKGYRIGETALFETQDLDFDEAMKSVNERYGFVFLTA
jgi:hypothetical protein